MKYETKAPINKGWSCDKKYCVITADGTKYLLRITAVIYGRRDQIAALLDMSLNDTER